MRGACEQTMVMHETRASHDQSGWCVVGESISAVISEPADDKSDEVNDEGAHAGHGER